MPRPYGVPVSPAPSDTLSRQLQDEEEIEREMNGLQHEIQEVAQQRGSVVAPLEEEDGEYEDREYEDSENDDEASQISGEDSVDDQGSFAPFVHPAARTWGSNTDAAQSTGKRKTRAQHEMLEEWMPQFISAVMTRVVESNGKLTHRLLCRTVREELEQVPEEEHKATFDEIIAAFKRSSDCVASCFDAMCTIALTIGHLARDPAASPFEGGEDARGTAELDYKKLEAAWRIVGPGMDPAFCKARSVFEAAVCNRRAVALPNSFLPAAGALNLPKRCSNRAVISIASSMTPVCAGLENVGRDSADVISTTLDIIRCAGALDKHPIDENDFYFKLDSEQDSKFNDGSAAFVFEKLLRLKDTIAVKGNPRLYDLLERAAHGTSLRYEIFVHCPLMRLKPVVDAAAEMLDDFEATSAYGRVRGGKYQLDGSLHFRGREYARDDNLNRVLLSSSIASRICYDEGQETTELKLHYRDGAIPVMEVAQLAGEPCKMEVKLDNQSDAAAFRKVICLHEYSRSELEAFRRAHASPECPNKALMYYLAALILPTAPALPEFGQTFSDPPGGEDEEAENGAAQLQYKYQPNPDALASIAASIIGDTRKFCYEAADSNSRSSKGPTSQWFSWSPEHLWARDVEPKVLDAAIKSLEVAANAVEKKLGDSISFEGVEHHFKALFRCSLQPWARFFEPSIDERRADVLFRLRANIDNVVKRLKAARDPLAKDVMSAFSRICYAAAQR